MDIQVINKEKTISYKSTNGDDVTILKSNIAFFRIVKNNKRFGFVLIIGLKNQLKDQHEFFDYKEEAEDLMFDITDALGGEDEFYDYENEADEVVSVRKSDIGFIRNIEAKDKEGRFIIIGFKYGAKAQSEYFSRLEDSKEFEADLIDILNQ